MRKVYKGLERRRFPRFGFVKPLSYKLCKRKTISKLLKGYIVNISQAGLLCSIKEKIKKGDTLWLSFDRNKLNIFESMDKRCLIYQSGIVGKVAWKKQKKNNTWDVGIVFITREEKNLTNIYPKIHFLKDKREIFKRKNEKELGDLDEIGTQETMEEGRTELLDEQNE